MANDRHGDDKPDKIGGKAQHHQHNDAEPPKQHGERVFCAGDYTGDGSGDGICFPLGHEGDGHNTNGKHEAGKDAANRKIHHGEHGLFQSEYTLYDLGKGWECAVLKIEGKSYHGGTRPDEQDNGEHACKDAYIEDVCAPSGKAGHKRGLLAGFYLPA